MLAAEEGIQPVLRVVEGWTEETPRARSLGEPIETSSDSMVSSFRARSARPLPINSPPGRPCMAK
jgi:hypothetical protein